MNIRDAIEKADPCNVCEMGSFRLRRQRCQRLGCCYTRDAWAAVKREVALMEAVCKAEDIGTDEELTRAGARLQDYREERGR